jgi:branched-chain amino acid transport system substrate-binding protein
MHARSVVVLAVLVVALAACSPPSPTGTAAGGQGTTDEASVPAAEGAASEATEDIAPADLEGEPIPICVAVAQTSNVALLGQEEIIGVELAEQLFNERGGVNGRPIDVVIQDTGGDEAGAINAFETCINSVNAIGIVGPTLSQQMFAAGPVADRAGVPTLGPSTTAQGIPQIGDYIGRVSAPVAVVAPNAVEVALEQNPDIQTVAVAFAQNDAFASSETQTFQAAVQERGLNLATVQQFQTTDTDFTAQATNIIGVNPELVIVSGLAADGGNLVRQLRELGYQGLIVGGNGLNSTNVFPVCGQYCDGIIIAQAYSPETEGELNEAFRTAYEVEQDRQPPQFSAQAFTGVQVFVEALTALDAEQGLVELEADLAGLRTALNETLLGLEYDTVLGPMSFTEEGEINQEQFHVAQIEMNDDGQTGQFTFVR